MKKTNLILIIFTFFCIKANFVLADEEIACEEIIPEPEILFEASYGKLNYNREKSREEITEIGKEFGVVEKGLFAAGLSTINISWEISIDTINHISQTSGDVCVIPVKINMFLGYENPTIYIDKNLKEDTCEYDVVLRHEQTHQQINKTALDYFAIQIEQMLPQVGKEVLPRKAESLTELAPVNEEISKEYISFVEPMVETFKAKLKEEQKKLDSLENYQREGALCKEIKHVESTNEK
ncbi:MAG: hypothetical protein PHE89_07115 [Alphaproteobacteria bacterium]|nr:hypothetical protein [Alphaproteobacteria bacterium]